MAAAARKVSGARGRKRCDAFVRGREIFPLAFWKPREKTSRGFREIEEIGPSDAIVETIPALPRRTTGDHGTRVLVRPIDASRRASSQDERVQVLLGPQFRGPQSPVDPPDAKMDSKDEWDYYRNGKKKISKNVLCVLLEVSLAQTRTCVARPE